MSETTDAHHGTSGRGEGHEMTTTAIGSGTRTRRPGGSLRRFVGEAIGGWRVASGVRRALYRSVVLMADYVLVMTTATSLIPIVGAWLHQQSGAGQGKLTEAGTIAMWVVPFVFVAAVITAGEIAMMRGMWRWATRRIQDGAGTEAAPEEIGAGELVRTAKPRTTASRRKEGNGRKI